MADIFDVANYFLCLETPENDITNLKLQTLCAYAQAMSLALLNRPLFNEELEAWTYGPVNPLLYNKFEKYKKDVLPASGFSEQYMRSLFDDEQKFILELTINYYGSFSALNLSERSHRDFPGNFGSKQIIPQDKIREAFLLDPVVQKLQNAVCDDFDRMNDKEEVCI